jgi:uncharacterized damage-inducible protein DinB
MADADRTRTQTPPRASERETLTAFLDRQRELLAWKCGGVDARGLRLQVAASSMTMGGLLKHMALVENYWFVQWMLDERPGAPWEDADWDADRDWDWTSAAQDSPEELFALWRAAVARSDEVVAQAAEGLDTVARKSPPEGWEAPSLRWVLVHMIEEYARHVGHADLMREAYDGEVGEDP